MSNVKDVDLPRYVWHTPTFLLIVSPTPPVQSVDTYVRSVNHVTTKPRRWPYSMSMGLCPRVGAPLQIVNEEKCRLDVNRKLSPWKMNPSSSLTIPRKWKSWWMTKENTVFIPCSRSGKNSCTDFTMKAKFSANRRTYLHCFSWLKHWSVPTFLGQMQTGCKWYTYQRNDTVFFSWEFDRVCFQKFPKENQSKIVYFYSVINEYSLSSRGVRSTPSWHKWSDFKYRPWCLAIVVRTPPDLFLKLITLNLTSPLLFTSTKSMNTKPFLSWHL